MLPPAGPRRLRLHRTLRLIIAVGTVAAGLCLVIGMVAMVAEAGAAKGTTAASSHADRQPAPGSSSTGQAPPGKIGPVGHGAGTHRTSRPTPEYPLGRTLASYRGAGSGERGRFMIPRPGVWGIAWQYRCQAGQPGSFALGQTNAGLGQAMDVYSNGQGGHGLFWIRSAGQHSLVVISGCAWDLRVVEPKPAAGRH